MLSITSFSLGKRRSAEATAPVRPFATLWPLALLAVGLLATQGCSKEEAPPAPAPAPAPGAPKPKAAVPPTGTNAAAPAAGTGAVAGGAGTNAAAGGGEAVDLRLKWPVGKRYLQRMDVAQESETTIPGVPAPTKQESAQSQDYSLTVLKDREGGGQELELEFIAQKIDSKAGGRPLVTFDSKSDAKGDRTNAVAIALRKLVGVKIHYLTDTNGRIDKVVGAQELQSKLLATVNQQSRAILTPLLAEDNLKRVVTLDIDLPTKPVKVGESWPVQRDTLMGQLGTLVFSTTNTFKGWEEHANRRCAVIEFTGSVTNKAAAATAPSAMPISMTVESGRTAGKSWFDPVSGMIVDSSSDQEMTMKITTAGRTMDSKTRNKITVKVIESGDAPKPN